MDALLAHCNTVFSSHGNLFLVFFLGGLAGSLTHCLTMCGPLVACQAACGGGCGSRISRTSQWHYHAGRLLTYGAFGFLAAYLGKQLSSFTFWPALSTFMLIMAGLLFLASGLLPSRHQLLALIPNHAFMRGALMGFMPCGLLYAALMIAATAANPLSGMIMMWCFVFGTLPALLAASGSAVLLAKRWQNAIGRIGQIGLTCNGLTLLAMAVKIAR